jgi:ribonuclease-3
MKTRRQAPPTPHEPAALDALEARLGHVFADRGLLMAALTHPSFVGAPAGDYQRLEFLGDALVSAILSEHLFARFPEAREGALTVRRAAMVKESRLAEAARALDLSPLILAGPGKQTADFGARDSVLADALEAIVAALWLDGRSRAPSAPEPAQALILRLFAHDLDAPLDTERLKPAKSRLHELAQGRWKIQPRYAMASPPGPDGTVSVSVCIAPHLTVTAEGRSRREAEHRAAELALSRLEREPTP